MATQSKYEMEDGGSLTVFNPDKEAPYIPQSCYAFGARKNVELCRRINEAAKCAFDACMCNGLGDEKSAFIASDIIETLLCDFGYSHISTEEI